MLNAKYFRMFLTYPSEKGHTERLKSQVDLTFQVRNLTDLSRNPGWIIFRIRRGRSASSEREEAGATAWKRCWSPCRCCNVGSFLRPGTYINQAATGQSFLLVRGVIAGYAPLTPFFP